jgi:hypothetical protein
MINGLFKVHRGDEEIRFNGMIVDHDISESDYLTVDAGSTCTATIGLAQYYDVQPKGRYRIQFRVVNDRLDGGPADWLESNVIVVRRR